MLEKDSLDTDNSNLYCEGPRALDIPDRLQNTRLKFIYKFKAMSSSIFLPLSL